MCPQSSGSPYLANSDEDRIHKLYQSVIDGWNQRDARKMAAGFDQDGLLIGFDGTHHRGPDHIIGSVGQIFKDHLTPPFVTRVKALRLLTADVAILEAIVGMVPHGKTELDPKLNAFQVMTAVRKGSQWHVALFQNTPAQLHGRPEEVDAMTHDLNNYV